jgi:hypothetical protein
VNIERIPNGWYTWQLPTGEWGSLLARQKSATPEPAWAEGVETHAGFVALVAPNKGPLFLTPSRDGLRMAGKAWEGDEGLEYSFITGKWTTVPFFCCGNFSLIYDLAGTLHISDCSQGVNGWSNCRENGTPQGKLISGDSTYSPTPNAPGLSQWVDVSVFGDTLVIGQGHDEDGVIVWDGQERRVLDTGVCKAIKVFRMGGMVGIGYYRELGGYSTEGCRVVATVAELKALPRVQDVPSGRLNSAGQAAVAIGDGVLSIDGVTPPELAGAVVGGACWLTDDTLAYQRRVGEEAYIIESFNTVTRAKTTLANRGANVLRADGQGNYATWTPRDGVQCSDGRIFSGARLLDYSAGTLALCMSHGTGLGIRLIHPDKTFTNLDTEALGPECFLRGNYLAYQASGRAFVVGMNYRPPAYAVRCVPVPAPVEIVLENDNNRLVLRHADDIERGYILDSSAAQFEADARYDVASGSVRVVWWVGAGCLPGEFRTQLVPLGKLKQDSLPLAPPKLDTFGVRSGRVPNGTVLDMAQYVRGGKFPCSGPTHPMHEWTNPADSSRFAYVKFGRPAAYELWSLSEHYVHHLEDASDDRPNVGQTYYFTDTRWMPRLWKVGESFDVPLHEAVFFDRATKREVNRVPFVRRMQLVEAWEQFDFGPDIGVKPAAIVLYDPTGGAHAPDRGVELFIFAKEVA